MPRATRIVDGWPVMEPLGGREARLLRGNLLEGERVLGLVVGSFRQVVVATDHKVLIVKTGLAAGQMFGGKVTSYGYRNVVAVEVRTGLLQGEFELLAGGLAGIQRSTIRDKVRMAEAPNGVVFPRRRARHFAAIASKIREMAVFGPSHRPLRPPAV
jgi:hypothetical protein